MSKFSLAQYERISEILGNISVAWFAAGTISPVFVRPATLVDFLTSAGISLAIAIPFSFFSILLAKGKK